jgi:FkbM family methyltransferase
MRKIFLDVGGHEGQTLREILSGKYMFDVVYCFEPMPEQYNFLVKNYKSDNTHIVNYGLLDNDVEAYIYGTNIDMGASIYSQKFDLDSPDHKTLCKFVNSTSFCKENIREDDLVIMKLNCEGAEVPILKNLLESGQIHKFNNIMIDFDIRKVVGLQREEQDILNLFQEKGFNNFCLAENVMVGNSHESRIYNWLSTLPFANEILKPEQPDKVSVVLTACNRPDLLEKTLDSFFLYNTHPIEKFIIIDDGMNFGCNDFVKDKYDFPIELVYNNPKLFQIKSIDRAYGMVDTQYIFHMEEDWEFLKPSFIEHSKAVLEADENIIQVWLRGLDDVTVNHPCYPDRYEVDGHEMVLLHYTGMWNGFSFNPGLKRLMDWKIIGNYDGLPRYTPKEQSGGVTLESDVSIEYAKRKKIAMRFVESYVKHIGWDRHIIHGVNGE